MKSRTILRHFREGSKNIWRNGWMTVASVGAVTTTLLLVGVFLALMLNLNQVVSNVEKDVEIKVLIDLTATEENIDELKMNISRITGIDSLQFSSKDEELDSLIASMGDQGEVWELFEQDNPLNHAFVIKAEDPLETFRIADKVKTFEWVSEVNYGKDVVEKLFSVNKYSRYIGIGLITSLMATAIFLISNTIKITIIARKKEISIMRLVGATNGFIRWPFFVEGLLLGLLGSIVPVTIILVGYHYLDSNLSHKITVPFLEMLPFNPFAWQLSLLLVGIGATLGVWGSVMSIRKFLKV
ncbi:permease-like cell division protein FtsX (plasmid) [Rossellomorea sp. AcN35-11]|nr:permease-like cell division protein FtsX [Rossellomorea aquimaris]WJV32206.1 permease-like cell division protein FtsX [Rossellomorea sp. AcN35-11]